MTASRAGSGSTSATAADGTGLGLSLCRTIVTRHGGSITAFTNEHGGATFTMTLPVAR